MTQALMSTGAMTFERSALAQARLHELIPGGAHTYARGSDQYPEDMAPILVRGRGARVEDLDGNWLIEYGMGLRAITLGHGFEPVVAAVRNAAAEGVNFSRPNIWELRAAEDFLEQVPGADMVKFAKNGSDATTAAIKLARAATGRDLVAICGSQPFFSVDDWFIATTHMKAGIPSAYGSMTVMFNYNDLPSVHALFDAYPGRIAAVILEAATSLAEPNSGFLEGVRAATERYGAVLIFDEIITGMRWSRHGAQALYGVRPDLSTWGKANRQRFLRLGAGRQARTHGARRIEYRQIASIPIVNDVRGGDNWSGGLPGGIVAAYAERDVVAEMEKFRYNKLRLGLEEAAKEAGMSEHVVFLGRPSCLIFGTKDHQWPAVSGLPHALHSGVAASRSAWTVFGDLRRPH